MRGVAGDGTRQRCSRRWREGNRGAVESRGGAGRARGSNAENERHTDAVISAALKHKAGGAGGQREAWGRAGWRHGPHASRREDSSRGRRHSRAVAAQALRATAPRIHIRRRLCECDARAVASRLTCGSIQSGGPGVLPTGCLCQSGAPLTHRHGPCGLLSATTLEESETADWPRHARKGTTKREEHRRSSIPAQPSPLFRPRSQRRRAAESSLFSQRGRRRARAR